MLYTSLGHKVKINYHCYLLFYPYGHKGSEFAPIVINAYLYFVFYTEERSKKTS